LSFVKNNWYAIVWDLGRPTQTVVTCVAFLVLVLVFLVLGLDGIVHLGLCVL